MTNFLLISLLVPSLLMTSFDDLRNQEFIKNKVVAHRGAWRASGNPENSIASLKEALRLGCEGSEFDVWMTSDNVLVVNHDPDFLGTPIETSTYKELLQKKLENGERIPTVKEYLQEGMKQNSTKLILEIKSSKISKERSLVLTEKCVQMVKELGAEAWVDYIAFDYDVCKKVMELAPEARVAYLNGDKTPAELSKNGFFGLDYNLKVIKKNPHWIKEAQNLNLTVNVWTVNEEADLIWLLKENVAFITTNEPELLLSLIKKGNKKG